MSSVDGASPAEKRDNSQFYIYVDIDDTLVRSYGSSRIPIVAVIKHVRKLKQQGATLYCWSSGGAEYAKNIAAELGISDIFEALLPKPHMLLDDCKFTDWRAIVEVHPLTCQNQSLKDYRELATENTQKISLGRIY